MEHPHYRDVLRYHQATKHHYDRMARSLGYMDWANQPHPFRTYRDRDAIALPFAAPDPDVAYSRLYARADAEVQPVSLSTIAGMLELSLGLSAWKAVSGSRWALRINPSSGNLHPTEAHLIVPEVDQLPAGVYHYNSLEHALEPRATLPPQLWDQITAHFQGSGFLLGLTSIFWREAWKYGERAFRYCNHDVGHALAGVSIAAALFGWHATFLQQMSDNDIITLLGLERTSYPPEESEHPDLICWISGQVPSPDRRGLPDGITAQFSQLDFHGRPNRLSREHVTWDRIHTAAHMTQKPHTAAETITLDTSALQDAEAAISAATVIRQRRSAVQFDPSGAMHKTHLLRMLDRTLPRTGTPPFDTDVMAPALHLLLFVHRVTDLEPGLYLMPRNPTDLALIQQTVKKPFAWQRIAEQPPLWQLAREDLRRTAQMISCHQEIAGDSAVALGMLARFDANVKPAPYRYRHLFWEAGMIGQVLYLDAEAHGYRGTGIGCYFDDAVHELLGLEDLTFQSLYHFTIGRPVEDARLATLPPYHHLPSHRTTGVTP
jgi:SagB-type dehydrogenase family enzyme